MNDDGKPVQVVIAPSVDGTIAVFQNGRLLTVLPNGIRVTRAGILALMRQREAIGREVPTAHALHIIEEYDEAG